MSKYNPSKHEWGTDASVKHAKSVTPGEKKKEKKMKDFHEFRKEIDEALKKTPFGPKTKAAHAHITALGKKNGRDFGSQRMHIDDYPHKYDAKTRAAAKQLNRHQYGGKVESQQHEATYQGKEVPLNKPMKGDVKKSKVYVKGKDGKVKKVNFGSKTMSIKKDQPGRKKSYCARSGGIKGGGKDKTKANYWSRKAWDC